MADLALYGGKPELTDTIPPFHQVGQLEVEHASHAMRFGVLSGFLAGELHGGPAVTALEERWCHLYGSKHAIACNSATSGLLMAAAAVGLNAKSRFLVSPMTMSATAAAPAFLGATPVFADIETVSYGLGEFPVIPVHAVVITNLFGHPARLHDWRKWCDAAGIPLIEDNSQAPFAREGARYSGTIGHIGVFSFNVHKHIHCGEGGMCVTNDDELAAKLRQIRNHGEVAGGQLGLNLRLTELQAKIVLSQLSRWEEIMGSRIRLAQALTDMVKDIDFIRTPIVRTGCTHSYYVWPIQVYEDRNWFAAAMSAEGVPITSGYSPLLYNLAAFRKFRKKCQRAESVQNILACFEVCAYDPLQRHLYGFKNAFQKVAEYARTKPNRTYPGRVGKRKRPEQLPMDADLSDCAGQGAGGNGQDFAPDPPA